ncbi:MAG: GDYXXLXY domain-containing protein [Myxococcales bacterium]|nr:GDYXXLXY domain-containing protein [Myxococcales bacterium]
MSPRISLGLFGLLCAVQLFVAGSSIARHELALRRGTPYRFETAPVDPLDLFRGRYVQLRFEAEVVPLPLPDALRGEHVYAVLSEDARGFARITKLQAEPPTRGDYLHVRAVPSFRGPGEPATLLTLPFDRFYMEESLAPDAERLYRERARGAAPAYAIVRVHEGLPVLEDLHVDGKPIADFVRAAR